MQLGYSPSLFWDSSLGDIIDIIEAKQEKIRLEDKEKILLADFVAMRTSEYVARLIDMNAKVKPMYDYFPKLFEEELEQHLNHKKEEELAIHKAKMEDFIFRHNERMRGGK